jgi:hypothetical protein
MTAADQEHRDFAGAIQMLTLRVFAGAVSSFSNAVQAPAASRRVIKIGTSAASTSESHCWSGSPKTSGFSPASRER